MKHQNNGECPKCHEIINKYPGIYPLLLKFFIEFQFSHPEAHISCAGRGEKDQELRFIEGRSRAHFGQSAHNYNCALDFFVQIDGKDIYDKDWFNKVFAAYVPYYLTWYGRPGAIYPELPHVEIANWNALKKRDLISLVEDENAV